MKPEDNRKKGGRPRANPKTKATTPNITVPLNVQEDGKRTAAHHGMGWSEFCTLAIIRETARVDAMYPDKGTASPMIVGLKSPSQPKTKEAK